jgi:S-methylmethionine-dependent homocysteine/selenocysteine methylase
VVDSFAAALTAGPVVLDGGLATELERRGHDLSGALWSGRVLAEDPDEVLAAHRAFVAAGARVVTTASYQASFEGFAAAGVDPAGTRRLLRRSVELARSAAVGSPARVFVAASVGPYGAARADGSEYTGDYGPMLDVPALRTFHRERLAVLAEAGPDVLALETIPCLAEVEALALELESLAPGVPAWLSLTTVTTPDGRVLTRRGEPAEEAFAVAGDVDGVVAVGLNCTDPDGAGAAVELAARVSGLPVVVYPNSGESWDARARSWTGPAHFHAEAVTGWVGSGARLVGGCCRVTPDAIASVAALLDRQLS